VEASSAISVTIVLRVSEDTVLYNRKKDIDSAIGVWQRELLRPDPWYKDMMPNFRALTEEELPSGIDSGTSFTSVCINTSIYLPYLAGQCLKAGVKIKRGIVYHISDAADLHSTKTRATLVVNCTGLGARLLKGVEDESVVPARGQICIVRNEPNIMAGVSGTDDGDDECVYIMQRAAGGKRTRYRYLPQALILN
jgi:D-amino-acid oxidase